MKRGTIEVPNLRREEGGGRRGRGHWGKGPVTCRTSSRPALGARENCFLGQSLTVAIPRNPERCVFQQEGRNRHMGSLSAVRKGQRQNCRASGAGPQASGHSARQVSRAHEAHHRPQLPCSPPAAWNLVGTAVRGVSHPPPASQVPRPSPQAWSSHRDGPCVSGVLRYSSRHWPGPQRTGRS